MDAASQYHDDVLLRVHDHENDQLLFAPTQTSWEEMAVANRDELHPGGFLNVTCTLRNIILKCYTMSDAVQYMKESIRNLRITAQIP